MSKKLGTMQLLNIYACHTKGDLIVKITAVIAEYNPFHNGHAYQLSCIREQTGADAVVVLMSGDFTQRGTPALTDKYTRARMALSCGADLVLELPVYYATGSAEQFASGAIALLNRLNCVDTLCFGCECGNLDKLMQIARILSDEPENFSEILRIELKKGRTFPLAREEAVSQMLPSFPREELSALLGSPNNILALEYLKQLTRTGSAIKPFPILRQGSGYLDEQLSGEFPSATAIRKHLLSGAEAGSLAGFIPAPALSVLSESISAYGQLTADDFSTMLHYKLLSEKPDRFSDYMDCSEEFGNKIANQLESFETFEAFAEKLWSQELTTSRIYRCLLHILLDLRKEDQQAFAEQGKVFYARILGLTEHAASSGLLSALKTRSELPLLSKVAGAPALLSAPGLFCLEKELTVSALYRACLYQKYKKRMPEETRQPFLKI